MKRRETMATTTKPTKPTRYFYAVSHLYGRGTTTDSRRTGEVVPAVNVHRFTSAAAARAWAAGGSDYRREQDYREVLSDATRYVQRYVRRELVRRRGRDGRRGALVGRRPAPAAPRRLRVDARGRLSYPLGEGRP